LAHLRTGPRLLAKSRHSAVTAIRGFFASPDKPAVENDHSSRFPLQKAGSLRVSRRSSAPGDCKPRASQGLATLTEARSPASRSRTDRSPGIGEPSWRLSRRRRSHQQRFCRPPLRLLGRTSWRPPGGQGYLGLPTAGHPCLVRLLSADALSAAAVPRAGSSNAWSQEARGSVNRPTGAGAAETDRTSRRGEATSAGAKAYRNGCAPSEVGGHRRQKLVD